MATSADRVNELVQKNLAQNEARREQETAREAGAVSPAQEAKLAPAETETSSEIPYKDTTTTEGDDLDAYVDILTEDEQEAFGVTPEAPHEQVPTQKVEPTAVVPEQAPQPEVQQVQPVQQPAETTQQVITEAPPQEIVAEPDQQTTVQEQQLAQPVQEAPQPEHPQLTPEQFQEARQAAIGELANRYALSDDEADMVLTEPEKVLPNMAARIYMDVLDHTMHMFQNMAPQMVRNVLANDTTEKRNEDEFYDSWSQLRGNEATVNRIAQTYKEANPNASREQFIREVGATACIALRLPIDGGTPTQQQVTQQPAPVAQRPAPPPPPAGVGGTPQQVAVQSQNQNAFAALVDEWDEEDSLNY